MLRGRFSPDDVMLEFLDAALAKQLHPVHTLDMGDGDDAVHIRIARMLDVENDRQAQRLRQSALARYLLAHGLDIEFGREQLQHWQLSKLDNGKPLLVSARQAELPAISFSHSGDIVACAWAGKPHVGIDVEYLRPRDWEAVKDLYLHTEERAWVAELPLEDQAFNYYCLWCLKEAFYKCAPADTQVAMTELCFSAAHVLTQAPAVFLPLEQWKTQVDFLPLEGVIVAVVW
ncbi:MAG: 4'-phosphopantetheinyl transferase family protein [Methylophilus sp.]|uniref:4'-phosphopantetheinyl transferase family protein n=1 Tax=Methylophilus sp. TaxID=29541 RepID=UPI003FA03CD8